MAPVEDRGFGGCVRDALRKTYGRCQRYDLDTTKYMQPSETWGRVPVKILSGDFYQLPPVPASASLLGPPDGQSYEHQQGRKLFLDVEYVVNFVHTQVHRPAACRGLGSDAHAWW